MDKPITEIKDRLKQAISYFGITAQELSDKTKIPKSSISQYLSGFAKPKGDRIHLICTALKIDEAWLLGYDVPMQKNIISHSTQRGVKINVLGRVAAGIPIEAIEDIIDTEEITEEMARTGKFFGLQIKGDSMTPNICHGDVVIVRQQDDAESGDVVIATVNGSDAVCKRLRKYKDGIELLSNNPSYDPMEFSNKDIVNTPVKILGKVVELRRKF